MATGTREAVSREGELAVEITRHFDAPPALVFRVWASPEHVMRWYGPEGCALTTCEMDFRVGGRWRFCMSSAAGEPHWIGGEYREIAEPSRLNFTYVNDYDGHEMLVSIDFMPSGAGTEMRFRQARFTTAAERDGHDWGWISTLGLLSLYLQRLGPDGAPAGRMRRDGVAEDIEAARRRHRETAKEEPADDDRTRHS